MDFTERIAVCFPKEVAEKFYLFLSGGIKKDDITEVRLRANSPMSVTYAGKNIFSFSGREIIFTERDIVQTVSRLCEESVHTYGETMNEGFITLSDGLRIGVCGHAVSEGKRISGIRDITSVCIRIPHIICGITNDIMGVIAPGKSIYPALFYSPPGAGKTTVIRDIARAVSSETKRHSICVVDSRSEIYMKDMFTHSLCDFLDGYPKAKGIEIATRTLSPELIICDEIGDEEEAKAIMGAQKSGVPLIATAHAEDFASLISRPNIKILYDASIFRFYIKISRNAGERKPSFEIFDVWRDKK